MIFESAETPTLTLRDGVLYNADGNPAFVDADYFASAEDAMRWLDENQVKAKVVEVLE